MSWFQPNRWLGTFLIAFGVCLLIAGVFLFTARSGYNQAFARFDEAVREKSRLERLEPFPSEANYKKMQAYVAEYNAALDKLKGELKGRFLPAPALAPNEFQSRLRQAMLRTAERARANRVQFPPNFALGFDEYTAALPSTAAAPLLGQELLQVELLLNFLIDARVDSVSGFKRTPSPEERGALPTTSPTPAGGRKPPAAAPAKGSKMLERSVVDLTFASAPSATRKVLNEISSSNQQFCIIRLLHVHNQKDKGPPREQPGQQSQAATTLPQLTPGKPATNVALNFIVGNEHLETSIRLELVRFTF
jgi:hypothetical protein